MMLRLWKGGWSLLLCALAQLCVAQAPGARERIWADSLYNVLHQHRVLGAAQGAQFTDSMARIYDRSHDTCRAAMSLIYLAGHLDKLGKPDSSVAVLMACRERVTASCGLDVRTAWCNNLTSVYLSLGRFEEADSLAREAYRVLGTDADLGMVHFNQGIALANMGRFDEAMESFGAMYAMGQGMHSANYVELGLLNMGTLFAMQGKLSAADTCFHQALASAARSGNREHQLNALTNLAGIASDGGRGADALVMLDSAQRMTRRDHDLEGLSRVTINRAEVFHHMGQNDSAFATLKSYIALRDSILNEQRIRAVADVEEKYQSEKRAREIEHLKVANLDSELARAKALRTRNIYLGSGLAVLVLAVGLWNRLRFVQRSRAAIRREKEISEGLLHNILPEEVAAELRTKGHAEVHQFEQATILFSDFKGFTQLAETLSPNELVAEIDTCFKAFDGIMEQYRIEKIKTIGDAYMAAGGLPDPGASRPADVVHAALAMQDFMRQRQAEREAQGRPAFEMRVGIHTGPVVAGIVGVKKFQYDIWGDTVNTASRMESSGEVGRVNISESTHALVKQEPGLVFAPRGKVAAKGKGELEMFFVENGRPT